MRIRYENKINAKTDSISGASAVFSYFFLVELCTVFLYQNQLKEAKLKADYTAQTTRMSSKHMSLQRTALSHRFIR